MEIVVCDLIHGVDNITKSDFIIAECVANGKITSGVVYEYMTRCAKEPSGTFDVNDIRTIFTFLKSRDMEQLCNVIIELRNEYINNEYFKFIIFDFLTRYFNFYLQNVFGYDISIDDITEDIEDLQEYILSQNIDITPLVNLIKDTFLINDKNVDHIVDFIEKNRNLLTDDIDLYMLPIIKISPVACLIGFDNYTVDVKRYLTKSIIGGKEIVDKHHVCYDMFKSLYNASDEFNKYKYLYLYVIDNSCIDDNPKFLISYIENIDTFVIKL